MHFWNSQKARGTADILHWPDKALLLVKVDADASLRRQQLGPVAGQVVGEVITQ